VELRDLSDGGYRFLATSQSAPYSAGVIAMPGYEIVHGVLRRHVPVEDGFALIERHLQSLGRPRVALCAVELRGAAPYTPEEWTARDGFNERYRSVLRKWGLFAGGYPAVARTNVVPVVQPPAEQVLHAFSYTVPISAAGEADDAGKADDAVRAGGAGGAGGSTREISEDDAAILLAYARSVIIVPGYGLAVAQAQHNVRELADLLEKRGVDVKYAIHPVAGRMPGHMNVLLAEADVPYTQLRDLEEINGEFSRTDVVLVVGANDVTNPAARRPGNPVSGMPILDVDHAKSVIVIKRSMGHGYAGIENELYGDPKTAMLFSDAKAGLRELRAALSAYVR